jgi:hypothetical protein
MNARHEEKRGGTVLHEVKPMRTTRTQFHGKMRSRAPSKPCLIRSSLPILGKGEQFPRASGIFALLCSHYNIG